MERIANLLDIELGEPFYLYDEKINHTSDYKYVLEKSGVFCLKENHRTYRQNMLEEIFQGNLKVVKIPTITKEEKSILDGLDPRYKYIVRDFNGNILLFRFKPLKCTNTAFPMWIYNYGEATILPVKRWLFKMISVEDKEPCLIEDLKNLNVSTIGGD